MNKRSETVEIAVRLLLFGLLTSFGYLVYGIFLTHVSPTVLTLNTFAWLFILQSVRFDREASSYATRIPTKRGRFGLYFRSPLRAIRTVIFAHLFGFALCQFAYWYLFWSAASMLTASSDTKTNFATLALALLSLNTLALPLAMRWAKRNPTSNWSIKPYLKTAVALIFAIVLMEFDLSWAELNPRLSFLDGFDWAAVRIELSSPAVLVVVSLLGAVVFEAIGDFCLAHFEVAKKRTKKQFVDSMDFAAFCDREASTFIRKAPLADVLQKVLDVCVENFEKADRANTDLLHRAQAIAAKPIRDPAKAAERKRELDAAIKHSSDTLEDTIAKREAIEGYILEMNRITPRRAIEIRRIIHHQYWPEVYAHAEKHLNEELRESDSREPHADLGAMIGLLLSLLLTIVEATRGNSGEAPAHLGPLFAALCLLGLTGSSARVACILPLMNLDGEALVPPIYAVRSLIYFAMGWFFLRALNLEHWIEVNVPTANVNVLPHGNFTYWLGAMLALLTAGTAWWRAHQSRMSPVAAANSDTTSR